MKKLILIALAIALLIAAPAMAADLQWDYPADWASIDGYILYFNESGQTDAPYIKTVLKSGLTQAGATVTWTGFEIAAHLAYTQQYDLWLTVYNSAGESEPSNIISYTRPAFAPPADSLPSGTVIEIPNAAVTIRVP